MAEELLERKRQILYAVVNDYILSAEPVASSQVARQQGIDLCSASVRVVMSELEERGYLKRSHVSAGRIPTDLGFRFYVDQLMKLQPLTKIERDEIRQHIDSQTLEMNDLIRETCRLISERANQTSLAVLPSAEERCFKHIRFCRLQKNLVLAILVSSTDMIENKLFALDSSVSQVELDQMHNYLNEKLHGLSMIKVRGMILQEMKQDHCRYDVLLSQALELGEKVFLSARRELHVEGQSHLLDEPEFSHFEKMQRILRALEEKTRLLTVLDQCMVSPGVKIFIGDEVPCPEINDLALITATYSDSEGNKGVLGVLGPTRLPYARVVPLMEFASNVVTGMLQDRES